jgi:Surface antigen variable number repeat
MRSLVGILCCMSVAGGAWAVQGNLHDLEYVTASAEELHPSGIPRETAQAASGNAAVQDSPEGYRIQAVVFEGGKSFSQEQLARAFKVQVGDVFNHSAISQGVEGLRQLYSTNGHVNFTAVPELQWDKARNTVVLTVSIDEGAPFYLGRLLLAGDEARAGEANALRRAWAPLSGKRYNLPLLSKWLDENATFLPNDEKNRQRFVEQHIDSGTHRVDIQLTFP